MEGWWHAMTEEIKKEAPTLESLVGRAAEGDRAAMEELYRRTNSELWRTVRTISSSEEDAMDLMQEAYLKAFSELKSLRNKDSFLPWLKRIAINEHKQELRRNQPLLFSELSVEDADALTPEPLQPPTPERVYEQREQAAAVQQALSTLPDGQRTALVLYYCEQYSVEEIADQLGIAKSTVKVQLHRGRKSLEAALRRSGILLAGVSISTLLLRCQTAQAAPAPELGAEVVRRAAQVRLLPVKTGARVALERLLLGTAAVAAAAGVAVGAAAWSNNQLAAPTPPPEPPLRLETEWIVPTETREELLLRNPYKTPALADDWMTESPVNTPTAEVSDKSEGPMQPTEPTEPPKRTEPEQKPEPEQPAAQTGQPPTQPQTSEPEATQEAPPEETQGTLPTESPFPFTYQEVTVTEGQTWVGSFVSEEPWEILTTARIPDDPGEYVYAYPQSRMFAGMQIISVDTGGHGTVRFSLRKQDGSPEIPWLTIHILPKGD